MTSSLEEWHWGLLASQRSSYHQLTLWSPNRVRSHICPSSWDPTWESEHTNNISWALQPPKHVIRTSWSIKLLKQWGVCFFCFLLEPKSPRSKTKHWGLSNSGSWARLKSKCDYSSVGERKETQSAQNNHLQKSQRLGLSWSWRTDQSQAGLWEDWGSDGDCSYVLETNKTQSLNHLKQRRDEDHFKNNQAHPENLLSADLQSDGLHQQTSHGLAHRITNQHISFSMDGYTALHSLPRRSMGLLNLC